MSGAGSPKTGVSSAYLGMVVVGVLDLPISTLKSVKGGGTLGQ